MDSKSDLMLQFAVVRSSNFSVQPTVGIAVEQIGDKPIQYYNELCQRPYLLRVQVKARVKARLCNQWFENSFVA